MSENAELYAEAMMGQDVESFLASDIGRYLIARADEESADAVGKLKTVFPWRRRRITELQNQIWRAESIQSWLGELIIRGRQATSQLEQQED